MSFSELGLSAKVLAAVEKAGYSEPTPIQRESIPHVIAGKDILGIAQTGTGKTASFTLPMLTRLERGRARARMPRTLIMEPTRELAAQVFENFETYGANHNLTVALLIGGVSFDEQDRKLMRGADVLIATPGRLLDHFERGKLLLNGVDTFVIDEADRMLDMGFIPDIERICKLLPPKRQTLFFSATMPAEITRLAKAFLRDPVRVEVARQATTAESITQWLVSTRNEQKTKRETLRDCLQAAENLTNAIVFCNRKRDVGVVHRSLERHGFSVGGLHGDMDQHARTATLNGFRNNEITILVASDVAARGLDIPMVSHVYNYDVPTHSEDYVHRIGRTGRAGRSGVAITLVTPADKKYVDGIEALIKREIPFMDATATTADVAVAPAPEAAADDGAKAPARKSSSRRGGTKTEKPAETEVAATEVSAEEPAPRERPARSRGGRKRNVPAPQPVSPTSLGDASQPAPPARDTSRDSERARIAFGQSEFVPDFLLRPVILPTPTPANDISENEPA